MNRDGVPDLVTSLGHEYGILLVRTDDRSRRESQWQKYLIDDGFSQTHAMTLVDLNGDGRRDW
jgi:hypothetical protein